MHGGKIGANREALSLSKEIVRKELRGVDSNDTARGAPSRDFRDVGSLTARGEFLIDHRFFHHNIRDRNKLT
jgi:hypothetical protein